MQIGKRGLVSNDNSPIDEWRAEFARQQCLVLHGLIEKHISEKIVEQLETAEFYANKHFGDQHQEFASDFTIRENELALHQIHLLLNNHQLFRLIERITGCPPIGSFSGRIYRNLPNTGHQLEWHDDTEEKERLIGISINFSLEKYDGGNFQIRDRKSPRVLAEVKSENVGDAHIFRISPELQHCVKPTLGNFARTAAAGWFVSEPSASEVIKNLYRVKQENAANFAK